MEKDITIILTLFRTPIERILKLTQYKNYKILIFEQEGSVSSKNKIKHLTKLKFQYYFSEKNLGLVKATNFLISKVKTKFFLFTQPDVSINSQSIKALKKSLSESKNYIFAGPKFNSKIIKNEKKIKIKKSLNAACMLCDTKKVKKIGFFDQDFFLYWEDVSLMNKINKSNYKMIQVSNSLADHKGGQSTKKNSYLNFIRNLNFKFGEYLYQYKLKKLRKLKIIRQLLQNFLFILPNFFLLRIHKALINISNILGIIKFIIFYLKNSCRRDGRVV